MNFFKTFFILISLSLLSFSCEKNNEENSLPKETKNGANTLGFLLNGKPWVAHSDDFKLRTPKVAPSPVYSKGLVIIATDSKSSFSFTIKNPSQGKNILTESSDARYHPYESTKIYVLDNTASDNWVHVKKYENNIISGTFSFDLSAGDGTKLTVTSGRFDTKITPQ